MPQTRTASRQPVRSDVDSRRQIISLILQASPLYAMHYIYDAESRVWAQGGRHVSVTQPATLLLLLLLQPSDGISTAASVGDALVAAGCEAASVVTDTAGAGPG